MNKHRVTAINSYWIDKQQTNIPEQLIKKLYQFLTSYYHLPNQEKFNRLILRMEENGELIIHHGINQEIAGFCRTLRQSIIVGKKQVITYSALIYLNPQYHVCPTVGSAGLTEAIKYKLAHPQEELIYVAFADSPLTYEFLYNLSDSIYPKPLQRVPDQIITVINALKKQSGLISTCNHPMVVNSLMLPAKNKILPLQDEGNETNEFYVSANPDYLQGNSLLVYIPLHLANISYGLNHQDTTYIQRAKSLPNQKYQSSGLHPS
ncbi:hypothetical protein [Legionella maioricensis]|uniref:Uncharacterized protein n=1 Tax=Legionella maioricensis TaxID=2896528 RepID=A0A9X2D048_9GAMM|nr:hypothetical protein [Legionella maioricensis]MCL9683793.1 hypothetical protein [Legionella maioricensis]MCL9686640.1 hypothetical protein [Legionella maioricensis]